MWRVCTRAVDCTDVTLCCPSEDHEVSRDYLFHSQENWLRGFESVLQQSWAGDSLNDLEQVTCPLLASVPGLQHEGDNHGLPAPLWELWDTCLAASWAGAHLASTCLSQNLSHSTLCCSKITRGATSWNFWTVQTESKPHTIKPRLLWHGCVITNMVQNKCHSHNFPSSTEIFKWAPNLENLGTEPLAFDADWRTAKVNGSQLCTRQSAVSGFH